MNLGRRGYLLARDRFGSQSLMPVWPRKRKKPPRPSGKSRAPRVEPTAGLRTDRELKFSSGRQRRDGRVFISTCLRQGRV